MKLPKRRAEAAITARRSVQVGAKEARVEARTEELKLQSLLEEARAKEARAEEAMLRVS